MFGHAHAVFPSDDFAAIPGADIKQGTLNGIPAVMPGMWGDHLGVVDLTLSNDSGKWQVTQARAEARPIYDKAAKNRWRRRTRRWSRRWPTRITPRAILSPGPSANPPT